MGNLSCSFIEIEFPAFLNFFFCANRERQLLYCSYQFQPAWNCAKPLKNSQLCSRLYMLQSVPPPRLCSILWVSFVFLILLRGFSAASHGEWTRPGLKTLSWRCFFCFFFGQCSLCVPLILVYSMYNNCCGARAVLLGSVQTLRSALSDHRRVNTFIKTLEDDLASGGANPAFRRSIHGAFKWPPADAQISFFISCHTHMSWHMVECQVLLSV